MSRIHRRALLKGGGANTVVRGMGQGMRSRLNGSPVLGGWSLTSRSRHRSHVGFTRFRVVIPTFYVSGATDTDWMYDFNVQVGFEYPYTAGMTGIGARIPVTFGGQSFGAYRAATGPRGYILSDWINLPTPYVAGDFFGLWTTVEEPNQLNNRLPFMDYPSNYIQQYLGRNFTTTSQIGANYAISSTSITAVSSVQSGDPTYLRCTPAFLLIDYPQSAVVPAIWGDSIADGVGEGAAGSGAAGSATLGSGFSNSGYIARGLDETLGLNYAAKISLPGDSWSNLATVSNAMKYRIEMLKLANPNWLDIGLGTNDIATGTGLGQIAIWAQSVNATFKAAVPGLKIRQHCILPRTTSTDQWATIANQSDVAGFGGSRQQTVNNTYIRALSPSWGHDSYFDPNFAAENGYFLATPPTNTVDSNRWVVNGVAQYASADGIHPNSAMNALMAAGLTAPT